MSRSIAVPITLADLASGQWGMFTTSQARQEGLSAQVVARLTDRGYLERIRHGVYRIVGTPPDPADWLRAAWLALRPDLAAHERLTEEAVAAVVSHRSAAILHRLGDVGARGLEFTAPERRQSRDPEVHFHRGTVPRQDWTLVDGLPVTTPLRTIADLAQDRLDGGHLAGVVRDAVTTLHLDPDQVAHVLRPYAHHYGVPLGDGHALLVDLLQQAGIPEATRTAAELTAAREQRRGLDVLAEAMLAERARRNDSGQPLEAWGPNQIGAAFQAAAQAAISAQVRPVLQASLARALAPQHELLQNAFGQAYAAVAAASAPQIRPRALQEALEQAAAAQLQLQAHPAVETPGRPGHKAPPTPPALPSSAQPDQHTEA